jgi:cytochrome c biogenesis protein CcmG, thiol:disulfide interchange protein DsbE
MSLFTDVAGQRVPRARLGWLGWIALFATLAAGHTGAATPSLDLEKFRGKVVVVDFWASWCKPCRQSLPWLNEMNSRYGRDGLVVIGVNVDAERSDADRFLRAVPLEFEVVFDPQGGLAQRFNVQGMPSSFVFDRAGKLVESRIGFRDAQKAGHESTLKKLLSTPTS